MFELKAAGVRYGRGHGAVQALCDVNLQIAPGERVALIGANGCGKSTLLRLLNKLIAPSAGSAWANPDFCQAMLFQKPYLMRLSVLANVALGLWLRGTSWGTAKDLAMQSLQRVGLDGLAARNARALSGGQQQRLCIARGIAIKPEVLLLDEPCSALDPISTAKIEELITELKTDYTVVIVTHNMQQAARCSDYTAYMYLGDLMEFGSTEQMFFKPSRKETEDYITGRFG